jgi:MFS family permease
VLGLLLVAYIFSYIDRNILALLVEPIRRDLGISDFEMSLLQGPAFAILYSTMAVPVAYLADSRNRKNIIAWGIAIWSAMTAGSAFARSFGALFGMRLGVGLGEAALSPPAASLLSDFFPARRLPRAMAVYSLGISLGTGMSFLVGGLVVALVSGVSLVEVPLLGEMRSWQLTLFVIGVPGLLLSLLVYWIREPARRGGLLDRNGELRRIPFDETLRFIGSRWRLYISFPVATGFLGMFGYGMSAWYPTFLVRTYGLSIGQAAAIFGGVYVIFGPLGTLFGVRLAERLDRRGYRDAHIRFVMIVSWIMMFFGVVGPLMPNPVLAITMVIPAVFLKSSYLGSSASAMQMVSPNQYRAKLMALQTLFATIIGMTVGASGTAFLTDFVFVDDLAIRYSLSTIAAVTCALGALVCWTCLAPYRKAMDEAEELALLEEEGDGTPAAGPG